MIRIDMPAPWHAQWALVPMIVLMEFGSGRLAATSLQLQGDDT